MAILSRFNPRTGVLDFWHEFRKPNPLRLPILLASTVPLLVMFYWLSGEVHYKKPERPQITYITTFDPQRSDEEIIASNVKNQELKEMREAAAAELAERKRELYKALGKGIGMDVDEIAARADARRAAEEAAEAERRAKLFGDGASAPADAQAGDPAAPAEDSPSEGRRP